MLKLYVIAVSFVLFGIAVGDLKTFFDAFPNGDIEALKNLTQTDLSAKEEYVEPTPYYNACPTIPIPADTNNVHSLKPGHIKVVMAMGDSITAAMSAKDTTILNLREYRGISFAIGGDAGVTTVANLLKPYAPTGYPIGYSLGIGKRSEAGDGLNAAVSGAINSDMYGQAQWLVQQLKANPRINIAQDWKVLTIWIGSNNLCVVCKNDADNNADNFEKHLMTALEYIYTNIPRVFVNLLAPLDVTKLYDIKSGTCGSLHSFECSCAASTAAATRNLVTVATANYATRANKIAANFAARNSSSFAVVVQPFLINSPIYNRTYLSTADCFHPSALCHQALSIALWNSMLTPIAQKKLSWDPAEVPTCATANSLLYTA